MDSDQLLGQVVDGRFRVSELLGEGGMARVYLAEQLSMGRTVALKVIREELALEPSVVVRFRREVEAVSRLRSPHVITFYEFGKTGDGLLYIAMERLVGTSLRERLKKHGRIHPTDVIGVIRQVCSALGEAHRAGVSHRDLKPENIFFCDVPTPLSAFVKVIDFGLTKLNNGLDSGLNITAKKTTVGTPAYIPPEMAIAGRTVDHRADLYSLGVAVFEMLVGELPFMETQPVQMVLAHARSPIPSAVERAVHLPEGVDSFMQIAMAKDPNDRFQDADTFAKALATALGDRRRGQ